MEWHESTWFYIFICVSRKVFFQAILCLIKVLYSVSIMAAFSKNSFRVNSSISWLAPRTNLSSSSFSEPRMLFISSATFFSWIVYLTWSIFLTKFICLKILSAFLLYIAYFITHFTVWVSFLFFSFFSGFYVCDLLKFSEKPVSCSYCGSYYSSPVSDSSSFCLNNNYLNLSCKSLSFIYFALSLIFTAPNYFIYKANSLLTYSWSSSSSSLLASKVE